MSEANKELVRRYYNELMSSGNLLFIDHFMSPEFEFTNPTHRAPYRGQEFKNLVSMLRGAFPDLHFTIEHLISQGDTVVGHWTARGTHTGTPLETINGDIPAKGKAFAIDGMSWIRIINQKFVEARINEDTLGLLRQLGVLSAPIPSPEPTSTEDNQALVARYFNEVMNEGKIDVIDEIAAPNAAFRIPTLPEPLIGPEKIKDFARGLYTAFPDLKFTIERQITEADKVATRWFLVGTHKGIFLGVPPSGRKMTDQGIDVFIIAGGKIAEIWVNEDSLSMLRQIGGV